MFRPLHPVTALIKRLQAGAHKLEIIAIQFGNDQREAYQIRTSDLRQAQQHVKIIIEI